MARIRYGILGIAVILCVLGAGCATASVGDVLYTNDSLLITATNQDTSTQAVLQIAVYAVDNLTQTELFRKAEFVRFEQGTHQYREPVTLEPGDYKVYVYIIVDGDSKARVIRDLTV